MSNPKPNMVFIVADQWRGDCLGLYRNAHPVMTPHINQLAAEGVAFTRAYADCPICMPQRVTMLTGHTGSQLRCLTNFSCANRPVLDHRQTLPARLAREAGYQTKAIGKMHFAPARARYGFEHVTLHPDDYLWWLEDHGHGGTFRGHGLGGNEVYPAVASMPERYYHTTWIVDESIRFLDQRDPETPFFLFIVFEAPHSPFDPPQPYDRMYDNFSIRDPLVGAWRSDSDCPSYYTGNEISRKWDQLSPEMIRETRRRYYGQISHIDYQLGRLFGALRTYGIDRSTFIAFTADHGELLGDHGLFAKHCFLDAAARVPLIVRPAPGESDAARSVTNHCPVMTADICPTMLAAAGLEPSGDCEGRVLQSDRGNEDRIVFGETPQMAMAVDARYKYIYYAAGAVEQLFDTIEDPNDLNNLVTMGSLENERKRLRSQLTEYLVGNGSDLVDSSGLVRRDAGIDSARLRAQNPFACRGTMRGGMGY